MNPDFNKQKLIPAIVQDYKTKEVLMLAYVNDESYNYMLDKNETCFFLEVGKNYGTKEKHLVIFKKLRKCI